MKIQHTKICLKKKKENLSDSKVQVGNNPGAPCDDNKKQGSLWINK